MSKYSYKFKKKIVDEYNNNQGGYLYLANKYGLSDKKIVRQWVNNYNAFGDDGLMRSRKKDKYSFEKKLSIVELYLSSELSYQEIAFQEGITSPTLISSWVNRFRVAGPDALRPRKKGPKKTMDKPTKKATVNSNVETTVDTSAEHVKELEDELLKLRIENAFLKELRRLRLEDEARMRELHKSSTVSEDNSN